MTQGEAGQPGVSSGGRDGQVEVVRDSYSGVSRLVVANDAGDVRISAGPDGSAQAERALRWTGDARPEVVEEVMGDTLRITARCPDRLGGEQCSVDVTVTLPAAGGVDTVIGAGDVTVDGLAGSQKLATAAGDVTGTGLRAAQVEARSSAGDVTLTFAEAPSQVTAQGVAGDVQVRLPAGQVYDVEAGSTVGHVTVTVPRDGDGQRRISARTVTGDVRVVEAR